MTNPLCPPVPPSVSVRLPRLASRPPVAAASARARPAYFTFDKLVEDRNGWIRSVLCPRCCLCPVSTSARLVNRPFPYDRHPFHSHPWSVGRSVGRPAFASQCQIRSRWRSLPGTYLRLRPDPALTNECVPGTCTMSTCEL